MNNSEVKQQVKQKAYKEKLGSKMSRGRFERFRHIPRNLHACVHPQERTEKALSSYLGLTLKLCTQEMKAKAVLSTVWLNVKGMLQYA